MTLEEYKLAANKSMLDRADEIAETFTSQYSKTERDSWTEQKVEAKNVVNGLIEPVDASLLMKLTDGNEATVEILAASILAKADYFETVVSELIKIRQIGSTMIDSASSTEEVDAIMVQLEQQALTKAAELGGN